MVFPKIKRNILLFILNIRYINNCSICQEAKHDRNPEKINFEITETPKQPNEIIHMDIYYATQKEYFLTFIDKYTKHLSLFPLKDRNNISILELIKIRIALLGKPKKIICDEEFNTLNIREFVNNEAIKIHFTTPYVKTGNSDIERIHGTLNEHIRIFNAKKEIGSLKEKVIKAAQIYNDTYHHSTGRKPLEFIKNEIDLKELDQIAEKIYQNKIKIIERLNKKRKEFIEPSFNNEVLVQSQIPRTQKKLAPKYIKTKINKNENQYYSNKRKIHKKQFRRKYKYQGENIYFQVQNEENNSSISNNTHCS